MREVLYHTLSRKTPPHMQMCKNAETGQALVRQTLAELCSHEIASLPEKKPTNFGNQKNEKDIWKWNARRIDYSTQQRIPK